MQDRIIKYIIARNCPVSTYEIGRDVLKLSGGAMDMVEKIVAAAVAGNPGIYRDAQGMWRWKVTKQDFVKPETRDHSDLFTLFQMAFYRSQDQRTIPAGISACKLVRGNIVEFWSGSFHYKNQVIPREYFDEVGLPVPKSHDPGFAEDTLDNFISFCEDSYLVCFHFNPHFRVLQELAQHYLYDSIENPVISIRLVGEQLFPDKKFVRMEDLLSIIPISYTETHEVEPTTRTLAHLFLELKIQLKEKGIEDGESILAYQSKDSKVSFDFNRPGIDIDFFDTLPQTPGIYLMENENGKVFYVGKAKNLAQRIKTHFLPNSPEPEKQETIFKQVHHINFESTGSELEALLKEFLLIQKIKPSLNQQFDTHERVLAYSIPSDFILVLPSADSESAEVFIVLRDYPVHQLRVSLAGPDLAPIRKFVKPYFMPRKCGPYIPPDDEMRKHIVMSWASREWDHVRSINLKETAGTQDVIRLLKQHLQASEPLNQKIIIH